MSGDRWRIAPGPAALLALVAFTMMFALPVSSASASQARLFAGSFGGASSTVPDPYPFGSLTLQQGLNSVAVDSAPGPSSGDVYVTDAANHRVEKFDSSGHFLLMFGTDVNRSAVEAVRPQAERNVCPAPGHPGDVCQSGRSGGLLESPRFVAVDNSSGLSRGDVYVDAGTDTGAESETQQVELTGATGGTFTLTFEGETTEPIVVGSEPGDTLLAVNRALHKLPVLGELNVKTTSSHVSGSTVALDVVFEGKFEDVNVPLMVVDGSGLTPAGATAAVSTVHEGTPGVSDPIVKFDEAGNLLSSWGSGGRLDGSAAPGGPIYELAGIAVNPTGDLWALGSIPNHRGARIARAFEFSQGASVLSEWTDSFVAPVAPRKQGIAVDSEGDLYFEAEELLLKYGPDGTRIGIVTSFFARPSSTSWYAMEGFSVESGTGDLYLVSNLAVREPPLVRRYGGAECHPTDFEACVAAESFGTGRLPYGGGFYSVAVNPVSPGHEVYVDGASVAQVTAFAVETVPDVTTTPPANPTPTTATLTGTVNPSGIELEAGLAGCRFEWAQAGHPNEHEVPCDKSASQIGSGSSPVQVSAQISGLAAGHSYHFRLVASNHNTALAEEPSVGADLVFGPPLIESGSALRVSATDATLQLQVNPNSVDTHARIEYVTLAQFETSGFSGAATTPSVDLGGAESIQSVSFDVQALQPATAYRYRVLAENALGSPEGSASAFTTQTLAAASLLPDNRGYELVSPPDKNEIPLEPISGVFGEGGVVQAAADGSALTYIARGPITPRPVANTNPNVSQLLASRQAGGWSTLDITTPTGSPTGVLVGNTAEYKFFAEDLSAAAVQPFSYIPLSPLTSEVTPYLRDSSGEYVPLVNAGDVPEGTHFSVNCAGGGVINFCTPQLVGASDDLRHLILASEIPLTEGVTGKTNLELYEWGAGALQLTSQVPSGSAVRCGGSGPSCVTAQDARLGSGDVAPPKNNTYRAVSSDGSRVVFTDKAKAAGVPTLFMRDSATEETVALDVKQPGANGRSGGGVFQGASTDGSRVFFTDKNQLVAGASNGTDLYECEVAEGENGLECKPHDRTAQGAGGRADVQGRVLGVSEDGSSVYFVAEGVLTVGEGAVAGEDNLYRYDATSESVRLVAVVSRADSNDWSTDVKYRNSRVSPDGDWLAFMSERPLTGYDNRDASSGQRDEEVFLYDAAADGGRGKLVCASCNPTGARPLGAVKSGFLLHPLVDSTQAWEGRWVAASIPGWAIRGPVTPSQAPRNLSDTGRLFFDAHDALVPQDFNGNFDVYEFEPGGVGDCRESTMTFSLVSGGCVSLISSGASGEESAFLDASRSGNDVFFLTAAQLTAKDQDTALDVYDARVGGGEVEAVKPPACEGDACQSPVSAPEDFSPGSFTFQGPGNLVVQVPVTAKARSLTRSQKLARALKACVRKPKRKRAACERGARRVYGRIGKAKKSSREAARSNGRDR